MEKKHYTPIERLLFVTKSPFRQKILVKRTGSDVQYIVKLFIVGSCASGKTAFVRHWIEGKCSDPERLRLTVGVDLAIKNIQLGPHKLLTLQIWDFGGEIRFRNIVSLFLGGSSFGLVFFDMTVNQTLVDVKNNWLPLISRYYDVDLSKEGQNFIALVGNKSDLIEFTSPDERVTKGDLKDLKKKYPLQQFIVSAKTGHNLDSVIAFVIENIKKILPGYV